MPDVFIAEENQTDPKCVYLCGNSLGLQPRNTQKYIESYLRTWATKGVTGHFVQHEDQLLPPFVDVDEAGAKLMAPIVGARQSEVAVMGTLTGNLHLLMASFYRPTQEKYKILIEGKAFPSDHVGYTYFKKASAGNNKGANVIKNTVCCRVSDSASQFRPKRCHGSNRARQL